MRSVGGGDGLDITQDTKPPKSLYIEVSTRLWSAPGALTHLATPPLVSCDHRVTSSHPAGEVFEGPRRVWDRRRDGDPAQKEQSGRTREAATYSTHSGKHLPLSTAFPASVEMWAADSSGCPWAHPVLMSLIARILKASVVAKHNCVFKYSLNENKIFFVFKSNLILIKK